MNSFLALSSNVVIELLRDGDEFLGFGAIAKDGVLLRANAAPLRAMLSTPEGIEYTRYYLQTIEGDDNEQRIHLRVSGEPKLRGDICDDYDNDLWFPALAVPVEDELTWILRPCQTLIGGQHFAGFSYALEWKSEARKIYRITIQSTWELGGDISGVTHLHQAQCSPPVYVGSRDTFFSTSVLKSLQGAQNDWRNQSMQTNARHGALQCFDFQYSPAGVLIGAWEKGEYVRSLIQKNSGENVLWVVDEHHVEYSSRAQTAPKQILFAPIEDESQARNLWKATRDWMQEGFERQWNFAPVAPRSEVIFNESWLGNGDGRCWFGEQIIASHELLKVLADEWLPQIKERGVESVGFFPIAQSDPTEMGNLRKLDGGFHGDLHVSSICAVHRYRPAEYFGGMAAWRYYAARAHELGLKVGIWAGNHLSTHAPIVREHPEWFNAGRNGRAGMGGNTSTVGLTINWNSEFRQWFLEDLQRWRDDGGLDYIFLDSWGNLGLQPIHFNDNFSNNLDGLGKLMGELQAIGIECASNEGMGPFCPPRFSLAAHQTIGEGQNSLSWWVGNEDLANGLMPMMMPPEHLGEEELQAILFRFFAGGALPHLMGWPQAPPAELNLWTGWIGHRSTPASAFYDSLLALWPQVREVMWRAPRRTLSDARGVLWQSGARSLLWTYRAFELEAAPNARIEQIFPMRKMMETRRAALEPIAVYLFDGEPAVLGL